MDEVEAEEAASPSVKEIEANHDTTGCTAGTPPASQHLEERRCETVADGCAETAQSEDSPAPRSGTRPKKTRPKVLTGERESTEIDGGASFELTEQGKEANKLEEACLGASAEMDVDTALLKRRHEEDDGVKERVQRELQPVWKATTEDCAAGPAKEGLDMECEENATPAVGKRQLEVSEENGKPEASAGEPLPKAQFTRRPTLKIQPKVPPDRRATPPAAKKTTPADPP
ncbi:hypothetical protein HPB50_014479 [Hyalomma asiaticum]|uniref:Uncharacterized protein n=1 Tax=Hyalomma asiaticum TaxID=266040 RepID=A0ACB7SU35_HYAAI|nr:hypothetical protein HPB50_014479 [Hyalomma asiaticum]